ncbi:MAG: glycosyltransferase family 4 protein [Planctomycetota bacterium]|nr:glycosyltransferase family 4 protein [Planctomycetota bacterium]
MKIVMATINPLFDSRVIGGSAKHLRAVAEHLGNLGHTVEVLCTRREGQPPVMRWHPRVNVYPEFVFKQPFPLPYDVPAFQFADNIQELVRHLQGAERLYLHDGEFLFPPVCHAIPSVVSLRDCVYPETMLGSFLFQADRMIVLNDYCKKSLLSTAGRFLADLPARVEVIHNGFDWEYFSPTRPSKSILQLLGVDPNRQTVILHPHRPETSKGLRQTIETVDRLIHQHKPTHIRALVPKRFDSDDTPEVVAYMRAIEQELERRGLKEVFVFHDWLPLDMMPEYYSLGHVTLVLGSFVEAFGNSAYESLGCGTPAIVSRVSSNRDLLPDNLLRKVHFNDHDAAAALAAEVIKKRIRTSPETQEYLEEHYGDDNQCEAYARVILNAKTAPPMTYRLTPHSNATRYALAPWCYTWDDKVYHDFRAAHTVDAELVRYVKEFPAGTTLDEAGVRGFSKDHLKQRLHEGFLAPVVDE